MDRARAFALLDECDGDEIWSVEYCRQRGVPTAWLDDLTHAFESGFRSDRETIYLNGKVLAQYEGVLAVDLACKLGDYLGVDTARIRGRFNSRQAIIREIKEQMEEG